MEYNLKPSAAVLAPGNWGREAWRAPSVPEGGKIIFDEPGRVLYLDGKQKTGVCYRAYYFRVTEDANYPHWWLRVKHGGGEEVFELGYTRQVIDGLGQLDSDTRYLMLHAIMDARHKAADVATRETADKYTTAFAEGRLKKRKMPKQARVRVWIEPKALPLEAA